LCEESIVEISFYRIENRNVCLNKDAEPVQSVGAVNIDPDDDLGSDCTTSNVNWARWTSRGAGDWGGRNADNPNNLTMNGWSCRKVEREYCQNYEKYRENHHLLHSGT
jgi:hypothetical protein